MEVFKLDNSPEEEETQKVKISRNGHFSTVIFSDKPVVIRYWIKNRELEFYATPGDSILLTLEFNSKGVSYSYQGNKTARFFGRWKSMFKATHRSDHLKREELSPDNYLKYRKKLLNQELDYIKIYVIATQLNDSNFVKYYTTEFQYRYYCDILNYINEHNSVEEEEIKAEYLPLVDLLENIDHNNPDIVETSYYRFYLLDYIRFEYNKLIYRKVFPPTHRDSVHWTVRSYNVAMVTLNGRAFECYVITLLFEFVNPFTVSVLYPLYEYFIQDCSLESKLILEKSFTKYKRLSKNHKISRKSKLISTDASFLESIGKYKGYILYVDFWASWCAPCIDEMSSSIEVQKKIKNKNIKFLFFSLDDDENAWKNAISLYRIPGIHFRLSKDNAQELQKVLLSKGIPHYIIVGKNGKIIDSDAKRPSDAGLITELEKLLSE